MGWEPSEEAFGFQMENSASDNQVLICESAARAALGVRADNTFFFAIVRIELICYHMRCAWLPNEL